jgi:hypothetical protein
MGQRLNIEIVNNKNETPLANAYYHWDAYTDVVLNDTKIIIDAFYSEEMQKLKKDPLALAIALLEKTGAGVSKKEQERINNDETLKQYSFKPCSDRDKGLLSTTKEGMEETEYWEDGRVTINIDEETVFFNVVFVMPKEDFLSFGYGKMNLLKRIFMHFRNRKERKMLKQMPVLIGKNVYEFNFDEIDNIIDFVDKNPNGYLNESEEVVQWVLA